MDVGIVKPIRLEEEMKGAYLDYAMSVITARALPDVRDGLKPVQRRILYAMDELGLRHTSPYKKSARIVGEVLGKYHPHGDSAVYEAMVRMAQDFSMRYVLVDGQGNFGSVDGDPAAAMRYTEARLAQIAEEMLADIDKNTVDFVPNFDESLKEPSVLPARLPNLLVNGASGIAVGMATNIPPHNLVEVIDATTLVINRLGQALESGIPFGLVWSRLAQSKLDPELLKKTASALPKPLEARVAEQAKKLAPKPTQEHREHALIGIVDDMVAIEPDELTSIVKGPDFPTAGVIIGEEGIKSAYTTGHGRIIIRSKVHIEDIKGGRQQITVTELPYQVNKATLIEKIADLVREKRVEGISELRDESDRQGMRIVIELRRDTEAVKVLNQLYKYTQMQNSYSINMLALVNGQPRVLNLKMLLLHYIRYRRDVITRRTEYDLAKAKHRAHILEGLKIALDNLDEVIATIRKSASADTAKTALMKNFKLSEIQAQAILDMQLRRLAALERKKIIDEYKEVLKLIAYLEDLLAHPAKILYVVRDELAELKTKYGDARRTRIVTEEKVEFTEEDLIPDQELSLALTAKNYIKRLPPEAYRLRKGVKIAPPVKEDDPVQQIVMTNMLDNLLLFTSKGRVFQQRVRDLPDAGRQSRGLPLSNFVQLDEGERVVTMIPYRTLDESGFAALITRGGEVKRVTLADYSSIRSNGLITFGVPSGDELAAAELTDGKSELIVVTEQGQALRFAEDTIRPSGRPSGGIRGIRLSAGDQVIGLGIARPEADLAVVSKNGLAKRMPISEFPVQGRGGGGVRAAVIGAKNGPLVAAYVVTPTDYLVVATSEGAVGKVMAEEIPTMNRNSQGAPALGLEKNDTVTAVSRLPGHANGNGNGNGHAEPPRATPDGTVTDGAKAPRTRAKKDGAAKPAGAKGSKASSAPSHDGSPTSTGGDKAKKTAPASSELGLALAPESEATEATEDVKKTTKKTPSKAKAAPKKAPSAGKATTPVKGKAEKAAPASKTAPAKATKAPAKTSAKSEPAKATKTTKTATKSSKPVLPTLEETLPAVVKRGAKVSKVGAVDREPAAQASLLGWIPLEASAGKSSGSRRAASSAGEALSAPTPEPPTTTAGKKTKATSAKSASKPATKSAPRTGSAKSAGKESSLIGSIAGKLGGKKPPKPGR